MPTPSSLKGKEKNKDLVISECSLKHVAFNSFLYQCIGEKWLWTDKLLWSAQQYKKATANQTFNMTLAGTRRPAYCLLNERTLQEMRKKRVCIVASLVFWVTAVIAYADSASIYTRYLNARFSYEVLYADGLLIPQGEADNGDGQRFLSRDRDVELRVWGSHNVFDETLESRYLNDSERDDKENSEFLVTYKRRSGNWFVVSGVKDDQVFYQKTLLMNNVFLTYYIVYPFAQKQMWDTINANMSKSFKFIGNNARTFE